VLTLKGGDSASKKADIRARVGKTWVSDDLKGIGLKNPTSETFNQIAKMIESETRLWCGRRGRHRDHYVIFGGSVVQKSRRFGGFLDRSESDVPQRGEPPGRGRRIKA